MRTCDLRVLSHGKNAGDLVPTRKNYFSQRQNLLTPAPATVMTSTFLAINRQQLESCSNPLWIREVF